MSRVTQAGIFGLIGNVNAFVDRAEAVYSQVQQAYNEEKRGLMRQQEAALSSMEAARQGSVQALQANLQNTLAEAGRIAGMVETMDQQLAGADRYYGKARQQKLAQLQGVTSPHYAGAQDYFDALADIRHRFDALAKKYTDNMLPALLDGINYLFSSRRREDYEELIVLKNTVDAFYAEIEAVLPSVTQESLHNLDAEYATRRAQLLAGQRDAADALDARFQAALEAAADAILQQLDELLPDLAVDEIRSMVHRYTAQLPKVNAGNSIQDELLNLCYVDYPLEAFVASPAIRSLLQAKCEGLLSNGSLRLPLAMATEDCPVWYLECTEGGELAAQSLTHAIMYGFLSACPVGKLHYCVADPENRGNSIAPWFDAKKKQPGLFWQDILASREQIGTAIEQLNYEISDTLQYRLDGGYDNVFACPPGTEGQMPDVKLLLLYDFPAGFDEASLAGLRNILRNGSRCGIYTVVVTASQAGAHHSQGELIRTRQALFEEAAVLSQDSGGFTLRGLPVRWHPMPDKDAFNRFFSKYTLVYEGLRNRGIAFPPYLQQLAGADGSALEEQLQAVCREQQAYQDGYCRILRQDAAFPLHINLGSVAYPADIFADSPGYNRLCDIFGHGTPPTLDLPLQFDLQSTFNLYLQGAQASREQMLQLAHHVLWCFLSSLPVTKLRVDVIDPEHRGNSVFPFLGLRKVAPELFSNQIYTNADDIQRRFVAINAHIDEFIQDKLGNTFANILEYNRNAPKRAEAVTLLMLYDFPAGLDGRSLDQLLSILRNGSRCGVYVVICRGAHVQVSGYDGSAEKLASVQGFCTQLDCREGGCTLQPYNLPVTPLPPPGPAEVSRFIDAYVQAYDSMQREGVALAEILPKALFNGNSGKVLRVPIGIGDADAVVSLELGQSGHHGLIVGATGSGKSTLLHTIIMSSMLHYAPEQLHLYLMDFKGGTEFKIYESVPPPHIQLLALDAMQEFGESILENLVVEMERRTGLFKQAAVTSLEAYTAANEPLPRLLVVMDEFQILFNDAGNRKVAMHCAELTKRIVTEGRAFGIHLLMATQTTKALLDLTLASGTIEQMRLRIGLKCGVDDARYLFSDRNDAKALGMMKGPRGTAVMNLEYMEQDCVGLRVAWCEPAAQREYLNLIQKQYAGVPPALQVFEGGRTQELLEYFNAAQYGLTNDTPVRVPLGNQIKVAPPFAQVVDRKRRHNLLVCGADEAMAANLTDIYMLGALLNQNSRVYCIDGDLLVGDGLSEPYYRALEYFGSRFRFTQDNADVPLLLGEVYDILEENKRTQGNGQVFLVIKNLQYLTGVQALFKDEHVAEYEPNRTDEQESTVASDNPFGDITGFFAKRRQAAGNTIATNEKLQRLVAEGATYGIQLVVTSLEYQAVLESMYRNGNVLAKFPERIVFSLGENEEAHLIDGVKTAGLRSNTVYYTDGVRSTFQLKPYIAPTPAELEGWLANLGKAGGVPDGGCWQ